MVAGPIQVIPPGLLGFLQLKSLGQNPDALLTDYRPTIEMRDWLFEANAENVFGGLSVATGGDTSAFFSPLAMVVPANEYWWVLNYTVTSALLVAGDTVHMLDCIFANPILGTQNVFQLSQQTPRDITGINRFARVHTGGFFVPPGSELGFGYTVTAAVTVAFTGFLRFLRLPI